MTKIQKHAYHKKICAEKLQFPYSTLLLKQYDLW